MAQAAVQVGSAFWDGRIHRSATFNEHSEEGTVNATLREMARKSEELRYAMKNLGRPKIVAESSEVHGICSVA